MSAAGGWREAVEVQWQTLGALSVRTANACAPRTAAKGWIIRAYNWFDLSMTAQSRRPSAVIIAAMGRSLCSLW